MRRFDCPSCGAELHFDSLCCLACGAEVAFDPADLSIVPLAGRVACSNRQMIGCSWEAGQTGALCRSCEMTQTIPDLRMPGNVERWRRLEDAKRRLVYSLLRLGLPLETAGGNRLRFRFLADAEGPDGTVERVMTGHDNGLVTINVAEADDDRREAMRVEMGEPYRTLLGHCRHEVGHFFFDVLVDEGGERARFEALFGDPDADYGAAIERHYREGAPPDWQERHVSAYATMHPWEDWAETFAHWLHMTDGLDTALRYGLAQGVDPYGGGDPMDALVSAWIPLALAMNAMNRSMGQPDFYPFVLAPAVREKLAFVHDLAHGRGRRRKAA
ncbi:putative zinc-binding metallopeptidase [Rubellimicrobium sp. CFH 75288]|uniref:zinc-binding metallopeptidase family protein n=1 Tax=Rubellimicrobium sp. CFH 75288 TaxID=2697034 RepID=UPI0014131AD7|nr:putative zinc-binding metallopeptidase [Rubellimicrobium sp. CFH 75288]NAZ38118.1 hypothetical protein [Rubellimicrobium sp. CFH 75288]